MSPAEESLLPNLDWFGVFGSVPLAPGFSWPAICFRPGRVFARSAGRFLPLGNADARAATLSPGRSAFFEQGALISSLAIMHSSTIFLTFGM